MMKFLRWLNSKLPDSDPPETWQERLLAIACTAVVMLALKEMLIF